MLKPSGGFLKKLFDPTRMAQRKKPAGSITGSAMKRPAPSVVTRGGGNKGFFGSSKGV